MFIIIVVINIIVIINLFQFYLKVAKWKVKSENLLQFCLKGKRWKVKNEKWKEKVKNDNYLIWLINANVQKKK